MTAPARAPRRVDGLRTAPNEFTLPCGRSCRWWSRRRARRGSWTEWLGQELVLTIAGSLEEPDPAIVFHRRLPVVVDEAPRPGRMRRRAIGYSFPDFNLLSGAQRGRERVVCHSSPTRRESTGTGGGAGTLESSMCPISPTGSRTELSGGDRHALRSRRRLSVTASAARRRAYRALRFGKR